MAKRNHVKTAELPMAEQVKLWHLEAKPDPELDFQRGRLLPDWAQPFWEPAIHRGCPDAAAGLFARLGDFSRARLLVEMFHSDGVAAGAFAEALQVTWLESHHALQGYLRSLDLEYEGLPETPADWLEMEQGVADQVAEMFEAAMFETPEDLPDEITIYRGTYGLPPEAGQQGLSWTLSQTKANWFALRGPFGLSAYARNEFRREYGPLVLKATITPAQVLMASNDRSEREVVAKVTGPVEVMEATEEVVFFDSFEEMAAAQADPLLMDKQLQEGSSNG